MTALACPGDVTILANIVAQTMPTSVHLPKPLLAAVDRKARSLRMSRNALIVRALEREVAQGSDWPPGFFERLGVKGEELQDAVDEMTRAIKAGRHSKKKPPRL